MADELRRDPPAVAPPGIAPPPIDQRDWTTALAHYYRGEMARMVSWRNRLDTTTNWAIGSVAAMLSLALSTPTASHALLLLAMVLVLLIVIIESRRYRFFDVYRSRVRLLERHYYAPLFLGTDPEPEDWTPRLSADLRAPRFSLTLAQALSRRLRRNYASIFAILLVAWLLKTAGLLLADLGGGAMPALVSPLDGAAIGPLPGWAVCTAVAAFYGALIAIMTAHRERPGELAHGDVHV